MRYVVIDKETRSAYYVTDTGGISSLIKRSVHTIHNWFRKGVVYKDDGVYEIYRGVSVIKSRRRNIKNFTK